MRKTIVVLVLLLVFASVFASDVDTYCFNCLTAPEQIAYLAIKDCLTHLIPSWNCGSMTQEAIRRAYESLLMDHPEYYWAESYTYVTSYVNNTITGHRVEFSYNMGASQIKRTNDEITEALYAMVAEMNAADSSEYSTVRAVFDYIVDNCSYDELNLDQSLYSVMVNRSGVCASFSKAFEFIMQCLEIPCTVVYGRLTQHEGVLSTTLGHEWNCVCIDGNWYHVDVTSALAVDGEDRLSRYRFLCVTTDEILKTHQIENPVPVPPCTDGSLEFFSMNGLKVDSYSRAAVEDAMLHAMSMGYGPVARFSNYMAFSQAIDDLFTHQGIFQAIKDATGLDVTSVDYRIDEQRMLIKIVV